MVAFESRMAGEAAALIERHGGRPIVAPSMREVALEDNHAALDFAERLLGGEFDVVILLTGVGVRELFRVMETRHPRAALTLALGRAFTVARGPKPVKAMRELGLEPSLAIAEPNTWREVLAGLAGALTLRDKRVAVQEYGASNPELIAGLEARGVRVVSVPVYRWSLPADLGPLRAALAAVAAEAADVALFTSSNQVVSVMQVAEAEGIGAAVTSGFQMMAIASIGPICSAELIAHGIAVDIEPEHSRLGHLVKEASQRSAAVLARKRAAAGRVEPAASNSAPAAEAAMAMSSAPGADEHLLIRACRLRPTPYTPIWLMRQAGRYMPEYRRVREAYGFLEMCRRPELAAEVTVAAARHLGVDGAIIFADILLPLLPADVGLKYDRGDGPVIERPIRTAKDLDRLAPVAATESLGFVAEAIRLVRRELGGKIPVIGFAGAPFTLAAYLIEGGGSRQYRATKTMMYREPETWHRLMELLARATADYLRMQVEAGAAVVQLFDSWVGALSPEDYRRFVLAHSRAVVAALKSLVPVIHFGTSTGNLLELMREAGGDVIGLDWRVDLAEAWARLGYRVGVQGNLDPTALFADVSEIRRRAREILDKAAGRPGHIFNLGHGILPETPVDHVRALVDAVHEMSLRRGAT